MPNDHPAFAQCPSDWIEAHDFERLSFDKATWIPLAMAKTELDHGKTGRIGHRKAYQNFSSIIVPLTLKDEFKDKDWQSLAHHGPAGAWVNAEGFHPPGSFQGDPRVLYPVLQRSFETGEPEQWDLLQELEVGLQLFRKADSWIRPEENDVEVAKLERSPEGKPVALLFRAEHLRDYLCAKQAALLLAAFTVRDAIEEDFPGLPWAKPPVERRFAHGYWEGTCHAIHEGGMPYEMETFVLHVSRESVNPQHDMPEMPNPATDPGIKSESYTLAPTGRKLHWLSGRAWVKHWILPAQQSPRIRHDEIEARVHFQVENQENKALAGNALAQYRGWLWFRPAVIRHLANLRHGSLKWYTATTGEVGPASHLTLHFGVNQAGLVNVLGYKMAELPEWAQKLWVAFNVSPEGGLSEELHMSQNLAAPATTMPPEAMLFHNLHLLSRRSTAKYGQSLLQNLPGESDFFRRVHRFYCDSFEDVCELCKELHRTVVEPVDLGFINAKLDPANAAEANQKKLGSIKRLALWLDSLGQNGRDITRPLAAVYDLRIADAHATAPEAREPLELLGFPRDSQDYQKICFTAIGLVSNCVARFADLIEPPSPNQTS